MSKLTLYGMDYSPPVRACKLTLAQLGLSYEYKTINLLEAEHLSPEFIEMNPQHTVPVLDDNGVYIWDSQAICSYLVDKYANEDQLYPKDLVQRARVNQRLYFNASVLYMSLRFISYGYYRDKSTVVPKEKTDNVIEAYTLLETFLAEKPYICGDTLTIADFCCVSNLANAVGIVPIDASKYPKILAWMARLEKLPYYDEANAQGAKAYNEFLKTIFTEIQL